MQVYKLLGSKRIKDNVPSHSSEQDAEAGTKARISTSNSETTGDEDKTKTQQVEADMIEMDNTQRLMARYWEPRKSLASRLHGNSLHF